MNRFLFIAGCAALLLGRADLSDEPRFAVAEKTTLQKTFTREMKLESKSFRIVVDGEEHPIEGLGDIRISIEDSSRIDVTDHYLAMGKGRPMKLQRTFDKIAESEHQRAHPKGNEPGDADHERKEESELEGKTVLFTWNDEGSQFDVSFAEGKDDEGLLAELDEDMDLRFLLPTTHVAEGQSWDLEPKVFASVLAPGGDLKLEENEEKDDSNAKIGKEVCKHLEGKAHATWKGVRTEDGRELGVIALAADLKSEGDAEGKGEHAGKTHFRVEIELEGELLWDLAAGHFRSFQAGGKLGLDAARTATRKMGGKTVEMRQELEYQGESSYRASAR
jgi:hypothetical protein